MNRTLEFAPAKTPARRPQAKLLIVDAKASTWSHDSLGHLDGHLNRGDIFVVNDAATMPASLRGYLIRTGEELEVRLVCYVGSVPMLPLWRVVVFGNGNWRMPTEARTKIPRLKIGDSLNFGGSLTAKVSHIDARFDRLIDLDFGSETLHWWHDLYQYGAPIQYSYHVGDLALWDQQTIFAAQPLALEPPSSGIHLSWETMLAMESKGIEVVSLTHATGISSLGSAEMDALLPMPERYVIPLDTANKINEGRRRGARIIAMGTGVTRALESTALKEKHIVAGSGIADLVIHPSHKLQCVDGILSGMHDLTTSHMQLLGSFVGAALLLEAYSDAESRHYLGHEYGDASLILRR